MRNAKVDRNQPVVVVALRALGFKVQHTHILGQGTPDFVVVGPRQGRHAMLWVELKCGGLSTALLPAGLPGREHLLTPDEVEWHSRWLPGNTLITNRLSEILAWFGVTAPEGLADDPGVKRVLATTRRKYGDDGDILETLEFGG